MKCKIFKRYSFPFCLWWPLQKICSKASNSVWRWDKTVIMQTYSWQEKDNNPCWVFVTQKLFPHSEVILSWSVSVSQLKMEPLLEYLKLKWSTERYKSPSLRTRVLSPRTRVLSFLRAQDPEDAVFFLSVVWVNCKRVAKRKAWESCLRCGAYSVISQGGPPYPSLHGDCLDFRRGLCMSPPPQ